MSLKYSPIGNMCTCSQHRTVGKGENVDYYIEPKDFVLN